MIGDDDRDKLRELTLPAREATLERFVGSLPPRVVEPIEKLLEFFITSNAIGNLCAFAHLAASGYVPPPGALGEDDVKPFLLFTWGHVMGAMIGRALQPLRPDVQSGLEAAGDRIMVFAYEPWWEEAIDPGELGRRLDTIASAYLVGVSLAWPGRTATAPKHVRYARAGVARLGDIDRRILHERYEKHRTSEEIADRLGIDRKEMTQVTAEAIERAVKLCGVA